MEDIQKIKDEIEKYKWFHSIEIRPDVVTPGHKTVSTHKKESDIFFGGINLEGRTVLDIGAWNGYYSFEAKRRGASRVLATDAYCWDHQSWRGKETFDFARRHLDVDVEDLRIDVMDMSESIPGRFDVVLFLGVFYHLFDPIEGLRRAASVAKQLLIVETYLEATEFDRPAMIFYPGKELAGDATNWWGPNRPCIEALLRQFGFAHVLYSPGSSRNRGVFHAWRHHPADSRYRYVPNDKVKTRGWQRLVDRLRGSIGLGA